MADQPSPHRRFQFRLRTLMIFVTVLAVIMGTRALMVRPLVATGNYWSFYRGTVYDDASWWMAPFLIDAIVIGLAVWFVRRKP